MTPRWKSIWCLQDKLHRSPIATNGDKTGPCFCMNSALMHSFPMSWGFVLHQMTTKGKYFWIFACSCQTLYEIHEQQIIAARNFNVISMPFIMEVRDRWVTHADTCW